MCIDFGRERNRRFLVGASCAGVCVWGHRESVVHRINLCAPVSQTASINMMLSPSRCVYRGQGGGVYPFK